MAKTDLCLSVRIRPATRKKLQQIKEKRRWTLAEAVDATVDFFLANADDGETPRSNPK